MNAPADVLLYEVDAWAEKAVARLVRLALHQLKPRPPLTIGEWAERYRTLSTEESPDYGGRAYSLENTPILRGILAALSIPGVGRVVAQKSAQIGYTAGVVCNVIGYHIHWRPCVQVIMFPREKSAKDFDAEKFSPMVRATRVLRRRVRLKSRSDGNSATRKHYVGGLAKFVASNSPGDVKSTSASVIIIEEPDDTNRDVRGQGNSIAMLRERGKTIRNSLELIGGTPTAKGASQVEKEMSTTDQRRFMVACHDCGERHEVEWEHVTIPGLNLSPEDLAAPDIDVRYPKREVYGRARWEDAFYACPHCGSIWSDEERCANIRAAAAIPPLYGWEPTAQSADPGFYCNELQSIFQGSYVPLLAKKYMRAYASMEAGDPTDMISFENSTRGRCWEYKGELPEEEELRARAEKYAEWTVPVGALVPLVTVDVQHDRLAVTVWAVGRGEEMWLAYWGELYGQTIVAHAGAWLELEQLIARTVKHSTGAALRIAAVGIDCGDGNTSEAVYAFVRTHNRQDRPVLAVKGAPDDEGRVEIWTPPKAIDPNNRSTKASRYGVQVHIVGTAKAKDLILGSANGCGRIRLTGDGAGRMHWYEDVRDDFYEQMLSEIKIPGRINPAKKRWKVRTDRRNEALDCTNYAIYLCRHLKLHLRRPVQWDLVELRLRQVDILDVTPADEKQPKVQTSANPADQIPTETPVESSSEAPTESKSPAADWAALMSQRRGAPRRGR